MSFPQSHYGTITGRRGQTVNLIEKQFNVKIIIDRAKDSVNISSQNDDNTVNAIKHIEPLLGCKTKADGSSQYAAPTANNNTKAGGSCQYATSKITKAIGAPISNPRNQNEKTKPKCLFNICLFLPLIMAK